MGNWNDIWFKKLGEWGFFGALNDRFMKFWADLGYTGSYNDRYRKWKLAGFPEAGGGEVPLITEIQAGGWTAASMDPDTAVDTTFNITRSGFNVSGDPVSVSDSVTITSRLREPYPDQDDLSTDKVIMSDYIYASDTIAGVTNSSTEVVPTPITCWMQPDHFAITGANFTVDLSVAHKHARNGTPVAAVKVIASDGTTTREELVSTLTYRSYEASGLGHDVYAATFTSEDFSATAPITVDAIIYPWVGPAYRLSINGNAAPNIKNTVIRGHRNIPTYAYLSPTGSDTTGVASANADTAAAAPFLTITAAWTAVTAFNNSTYGRNECGGGVLRFPEGTWVLGTNDAGTAITTSAPLVYEAADPSKVATTILADNGVLKTPRTVPDRMVIRNVTLRKTAATCSLLKGGPSLETVITFENCIFDGNGQTTYNAWLGVMPRCWMINCGMLSNDPGFLALFSSSVKHVICIGNDFSLSRQASAGISFFANKMFIWLSQVTAGNTLGPWQNMFINNYLSGNTSGFRFMSSMDQIAAVSRGGMAIIGNVIEAWGAATGGVSIWADGVLFGVRGLLFRANTVPGAGDPTRINRLYSDVPGASAVKEMVFDFNVCGRSSSKSDVFASDGVSIGNWPVVMGVGHKYNTLVEGRIPPNSETAPGGWRFEVLYPGIQIGDGSGGVLDPLWTLDASRTGTNVGGGDYRPQPGSPLIRVPAGAAISAHDMLGTPIPNDGTAFVGSLQTTLT